MKKVSQVGDWTEYSVDGNALHNVYENKATGEKSYQDHVPNKITNYDTCEEHYFEPLGSNGDLQCKKCGLPKRIVWGIHVCRDGKIVKL